MDKKYELHYVKVIYFLIRGTLTNFVKEINLKFLIVNALTRLKKYIVSEERKKT